MKNQLVKLWIGIFSLLIASSAVAQHKVTGYVRDADTNEPIAGANVHIKNTATGTNTNVDGFYSISVNSPSDILVFSFVGFQTKEVPVKQQKKIDILLETSVNQLSEVIVVEEKKKLFGGNKASKPVMIRGMSSLSDSQSTVWYPSLPANTEAYEAPEENIFLNAVKDPLSTFSIDVDAASYANLRRFLYSGQIPPKEAVRTEEMINYFSYDYEQPKGRDPFSINTEVGAAPWNNKHQLVHIGLQGKDIPTDNLPASNLVFLIDVSGSMASQNKLPLLKAGFKLLIDQLRPEDKVAIVVYAGAAGCVLPSTSGAEKEKIRKALDNLRSGGSTAGGAGIELAYQIAKENFVAEGNNRIILATDGDFNVGSSSNEDMEKLIEQKREEGTFLTVLGFGTGNYKDSKMEILADKGNGNYAYIDNILEAKKVLVNEFGGTLFTIAKDVKIQVEFNPATVKAYRLIGYENRKMAAEDFNNDKKDAGELGSGHTVTALYEIIPAGVDSDFIPLDDLKYQKPKAEKPAPTFTDELMTVKFRYKEPDGEESKLTKRTVKTSELTRNTSDNFRWSAAVASLGMLLTDSDFKQDANYNMVLDLAKSARGTDENGYRIEFIKMVESSQLLADQ